MKVNLSALSAGVPGMTLTDAVPPSAPTNLRVLNGSTSELVLGWNAAVDNGTVTEYQLYADGALLGTTSGLSLAHSNLTPGSQHAYQVTAKDAGGNVSPPSATLTARAYSVVLKAGPTTIWKYRDLGALPDFTWRDAAYDDSGWASGKAPLGYGKADITANGTAIGWGPNNSNRYLTSYARTTFTLADPTGITGMALKLRGTDGAAVFVNGRLAYNDNLPAALEPDLGALDRGDTAALDIARGFRVPVSRGCSSPARTSSRSSSTSTHPTRPTWPSTRSCRSARRRRTPRLPAPPTGVTADAGRRPEGAGGLGRRRRRGELRGPPQRHPDRDRHLAGLHRHQPPSGTALSYTVRTVDDLGRTSSDSTAATVTITPPAAPGNLTAMVLSGPSVLLAWDAVGGASSYVVLRGGSPLATVPSPGYTDPSPGNGTITYTVRAVDAIGQQSADSAPASVTISTPPADTTKPSVPGKPVVVAGSVTDTAAGFTWAASTDNVGVTGYRIFRDGVDVGTSPTASFTATGLAPSTPYKFQVAAFDAAGNQSAKSSGLELTTTAASDWRRRSTCRPHGATRPLAPIRVRPGRTRPSWCRRAGRPACRSSASGTATRRRSSTAAAAPAAPGSSPGTSGPRSTCRTPPPSPASSPA